MAIERIGEVVVDGMSHSIQIDGDASRFEIPIGKATAVLEFRQRGTRLSLIHTEVPRHLQRKGLAEALAKAALDYARAHGLTVNPICPFVRKYLTRHPEYHALIDPP